jgi:hypothetical protein
MAYNKWMLSVCSALLVTGTLILLASCQSTTEDTYEIVNVNSFRGGETRPTLSPAYFTGKAAKAYMAAREIPEVLDSLYCYCDCEKNFGHKSLLSCYVDQHAKYCSVCIDEALMAYEMHKEGKSTLEIRRQVDKRFSRHAM